MMILTPTRRLLVPILLLGGLALLIGCGGSGLSNAGSISGTTSGATSGTSSGSTSGGANAYQGVYKGFLDDGRGSTYVVTLNVDAGGAITGSGASAGLPSATISGSVSSSGAWAVNAALGGGSVETFQLATSALPTNGLAFSGTFVSTSDPTHKVFGSLIPNPMPFSTSTVADAGNFAGIYQVSGFGALLVIDDKGGVSGFLVGPGPALDPVSGTVSTAGVASLKDALTNQVYTGTLALSGSTLSGSLATSDTVTPFSLQKL